MKKDFKHRIDSLPQTDGKTDPAILAARSLHARSYIKWSSEEEDILSELCDEKLSISEMAKQLKRSYSAIEKRLEELEITPQPSTPTHCDQNVIELIRYWRNCLADETKMSLTPESMKQGKKFSLIIFESGFLPPEEIKPFFDEAEKKLKEKIKIKKLYNKNQNEEESPVITTLQVIITPYTALKQHEHGQEKNQSFTQSIVFPLWLVANLNKSGELEPCLTESLPWIDRRCLTPNENIKKGYGYPILGDVSQLDEFYTSNLINDDPYSWDFLFKKAKELLNIFLKTEEPLNENYSLKEFGYVLPFNPANTTKSIIDTYDQYLLKKIKKIPALLNEFCSLTDQPYATDISLQQIYQNSQYHLGQMQNSFPLSCSQRLSLSYFFDQTNNDIFAINGPPGTGKTELLLSIISSKWIEAAIKKIPPPLILMSSSNNQAILNILDRLSLVSKKTSLHWLPRFNHFGLYLAAKDKAKEIMQNEYLYQCKKKELCNTTEFYTAEYRKEAKAYFLKQCSDFFKKEFQSIMECRTFLHEKLIEKQKLLVKIIAFSIDFFEFSKKFKNEYKSINQLEDFLKQEKENELSASIKIKEIIRYQEQWLTYKVKNLFWLNIFSFFPPIKRMIKDKIKLFSIKNSDFFNEPLTDSDAIDSFFENQMVAQKNQLREIQIECEKLESIKKTYLKLEDEKNLLENCTFPFSIDHLFDFPNPDNLLSKIDASLRYDLFLLAIHYWESEWIEKSELLHSLDYTRKGRRQYWEIQAMLTPCFVSTIYSAPLFFQYKDVSQEFITLNNFIDLLIIDEAGQLLPGYAGATISTSKKLLMVGDIKQIEPIVTLPESIDFANAKKFNLCHTREEYQHLKSLGILFSGNTYLKQTYGNLMVVGQRKSKFHLKNNSLPGLQLLEHRRCAKDIISYCNELCYDNQLNILTIEKPSVFPRMGYAHIKGKSKKKNGSRYNSDEAEVIADWITKNKDSILNMCEESNLDSCIGIITPFAAQKETISFALKKYNIQLSKIGTVHALQGSEKPIIIFSSVYTSEHQGLFFFDQSPNMLNVAVSRAKSSFLVFGDMDIFNQLNIQKPSSLLAKYLFSNPEQNEITDIIQPKYYDNLLGKIEQISSLERHRSVLKQAFSLAQHELTIVSPYLRERALLNDNILDLIRGSASRITITIYTDPNLNQDHYQEFLLSKNNLENAGAQVFLVKQVHSKIIAIDNRIIIEGSFNWLSASRHRMFSLQENSILYSGEHASRFIQEALKPIQEKQLATVQDPAPII